MIFFKKKFTKHSLNGSWALYYPAITWGNTVLLTIKWNEETEQWEVRQECGYVVWSGELRREAIFYARDREDDEGDQVDRIIAYNRDGSVAWGQ